MPRRTFVGLRQLESRLTPAQIHLDVAALTTQLLAAPLEFTSASSVAISLPRPDGTSERFAIWRTTMMEPGLSAQFPNLQTYRGQSLDQPANILAVDVGPLGFHAKVAGPGASWYIDPHDAPHGEYSVYVPGLGNSRVADEAIFESAPHAASAGPTLYYSTGPTLRTFRLAVAATGEYTTFSGGTVAGTQANIVTLVNRINLTLERDVTYRLVLVANNTDVIYTNAATDPFTNTDLFAMTQECHATLNSKIGAANYDIGHVFGSDGFGGGVAYFGIGRDADKGKGATKAPTWSTPTGVPFEENITHEMGHQCGAHHTFNGVNGSAAGNRTGTTAVEVGSGSTIMSYCGSTGADDLQSLPDLYYHSITYDEIQDFIAAVPAVGGTIMTGNTAPTAFAGLDASIPANTPFALSASANDINGDALTYSWEERDVGAAQALGSPDNGNSPLFRAFAPVTSATRVFPNINNLAAGTASKGETLPTTNRALTFRVYVRDNKTGGGGVTLDDLSLNVVNTGAAFKVTSPNTAVSLPGGSGQMVTWNVAGTTAAPINTALVNIRLSTDGGLTYPTLLAANTANDGSEAIVLPTATSSTARVKVEAVGNYFFDIGDVNFTITAAPTMRVTSTIPGNGGALTAPAATLDVVFTQNVKASTIGTDDLVLSQGTVTAAIMQAANTARYTLSGFTGEGEITVSVPSGAVTDGSGNNVAPFVSSFAVDVGTIPFATPLVAANPIGTLVYFGSVSGVINSGSDVDTYTINLDADQSLQLLLNTTPGLQGKLALTLPGGSVVTGSSSITLTSQFVLPGTYSIAVSSSGATTGAYNLRLALNTVGELEPNETTASATPTLASHFDLGNGASHFALTGQIEAPAAVLPAEVEPNNTNATANDASRSFAPYSGNLFHMGVQGEVGVVYFKLGQLETSDIVTGTASAKGSARGTMSDPSLYLYYNGNSYYFGAGDENAGPGNDALVHRFLPDVTDNYLAGVFGSGFFGETYQLGFLLENGGTAPLTTESITNVTQKNNTYISWETAADLSKSWRPVQYRSRTSGAITAGDVDVLQYQFNAGDLVTILADSVSDLDAQVTLRNSAGTIIAFDDGTSGGLSQEEDARLLGYVIPATGTYFVEVKAASGTGGYNLDMLLSAKAAPPAPIDFAAISLNAGESITVGMKAQAAGNVTLDLVNASNSVLQAGTAGPTNYDRVLTYMAPSGGTYYLRMQGDADVPYVLTVTSGIALEQEANDAFAAAQPLVNNRGLGGLVAGTEDWYQFTAAIGQTITVTTTTPGGAAGEFVNNLDPIIELYTPSNKLVTSDDNSGGDGKNAKLTASATEAGAYRVRVRGVGGSAGEYTLTATAATVAAKVASVQINGGNVQRSRVTNLVVTFDQTVTLPANPADAFQLKRNSDSAAVTLNAVLAGSAVTLTFTSGAVNSGSLADGRYTLTILAAQVNAGGFDGNGDGTPGDNYFLIGDPAIAPKLYRLFGDADGDNDVDTTDFGAFRGVFGGSSSIFDFDNDGDVDTGDFGAFRGRFGGSV